MKTRLRLAGACAFALFSVLALVHGAMPPAQAVYTDGRPSLAAALPGSTIVSSNITTNTTWTKAGSPYSVTQYIHIQAGIMLTVEPGVEVQFPSSFVGLGVQGQLLAIGSPTEPITFTGTTKQPGSWGGVDVTAGATATLRYVTMEYGRIFGLPNDGMLDVNGGAANVSQSVFRFGGSNGIAGDLGLSSTVQVSATTFISNGRSALRFFAAFAAPRDPLLRDLTASGNGLNAIEYYATHLTGPHVWEDAGLPYVARSGLTVNDTGSLTVEPGVEVQADSLFSVYGTLTALGTPAKPITFTGMSKTPGSWWGVYVNTASTVSGTLAFRHVIVEYGGVSQAANLSIGFGTAVSITQSVIRNGSRNGITLAGSGGAVELSDISITGNGGYPIYLSGTTDPVLRNITVGGNLTEAIGIKPFFSWFDGRHLWQNAGLPYIAEGSVTVNSAAALTIEPGVEVRLRKDGTLTVNGALYAVGTRTEPVTITGDFTGTSTPGWWSSVTIGGGARAVFRYCDIGYGGSAGQGMLFIRNNRAIVQDCRIHDSAAEGIETADFGSMPAMPYIRNNRIEQNAFGLRNSQTLLPPESVDAINNWWGDASGPFHATNPNGQGNAVSDYVTFYPWLIGPSQSTAQLEVVLSGPERFFPGRVEEYLVLFTNNTTQTVQSAVLLVALPSFADYLDDSGAGIVWPQRRQLFWKLGDLAPGSAGKVSFRVRFLWGLPRGLRDTAVAELGGTNISMPNFNVQSYLNYAPVTVVSEQPLNLGEIQAERQTYAEFDQLYIQALQEGYTRTVANRIALSTGDLVTEVILLRFDPDFGAMFLRRQDSRSQATIVDESSYVLRTTAGTLSFNFETDEWDVLGTGAAAAEASPQTASLTFGECLKNCIMEKVPKYVAKNVFKAVSILSKALDCYKAATTRDELDIAKCAQIIKKIPGLSEGIDLGKCNSDCQQDPNSHVCTQDFRYCDTGGFPYGIFGIHSIEECKCITDPATGRAGQYLACTAQQVCALCEKCVETDSGPQCTVPTPIDGGSTSPGPAQLSAVSSGSDKTCAECLRAQDPNAKYGPGGDVLPGQLMTYTITFENEGAGTAYDVFVVDELSEDLDTSKMAIYGGGEYLAASRTLIWWVGQLAPKGQPGSTGVVSFTVWLKPNLPNGTAVVNQAVVHFPSVPEVTPTNAVVNLVQPLVATPQSLETFAGQPVVIRLQGRDPGGAPLTYALVEAPLNGEWSGTLPNLVYTPTNNFTGIDRLRFTVSNGITSSRPVDVDILVHPSPSDNTPPQVVRTTPANGAVIAQIVDRAHFTDTLGPLYLPPVQIDFSEAISDTTVTTNTIRVIDGSGRSVPVLVGYDGSVNEAIVLFRVPLKPGTQYNFTITTGIRDLRGNALPANYSWSFRTTGIIAPPSSVAITGPTSGAIGMTSFYTATVAPPTATQPITYVWQATGQLPLTHTVNNAIDVANFSWGTVGPQVITVTAQNLGGVVSATYGVTIVNPVPTLTSMSPLSATPGGSAFTLTVTGTNFVPGSVVRWNGSDRATTYINDKQLQAVIPAADIASGGTATVTVFSPVPGGGTSNGSSFAIRNVLFLPLIRR